MVSNEDELTLKPEEASNSVAEEVDAVNNTTPHILSPPMPEESVADQSATDAR